MSIVPVSLHWLEGVEPSADLCAHGGVELRQGAKVLLRSDENDFAVSTGALHLLRSLERDHTPEHPIAEHLIPHCGHYMFVDPATGEVSNGGCPSGVDWWVVHTADNVRVGLPGGVEATVPAREWCEAVVTFADHVEQFYRTSEPKRPDDEMDGVWYAVFWEEWRRRRLEARGAI